MGQQKEEERQRWAERFEEEYYFEEFKFLKVANKGEKLFLEKQQQLIQKGKNIFC